MTGSNKKFGYIRHINGLKINLSVLKNQNIDQENIFFEDVKLNDRNRPELSNLILELKMGDHLYINNLQQVGNDFKFIKDTIDKVLLKGASLMFIEENLNFSNDKLSKTKLIIDCFEAFINFDKLLRKERQMYGIQKAREVGIYAGRKNILSKEEADRVRELYNNGMSGTKIAKLFKISRATLHRYIRMGKENKVVP